MEKRICDIGRKKSKSLISKASEVARSLKAANMNVKLNQLPILSIILPKKHKA